MKALGHTHPRRGLTLLEVLISTAILAALAAACLPAIARAMALLGQTTQAPLINEADLAAAADSFLADPRRFGVEEAKPVHTIEHLRLPWPADDLRFDARRTSPGSPIEIQPLHLAGETGTDHVWLQFECDGAVVLRWVAVPMQPESTQEGQR